MKFSRNVVLILIFSLINSFAYSQEKNKKLIKANSEYDKFSFAKANKLYKELIDKGIVSAEIYAKLGDTYYFNSNYSEALTAYSSLIDLKTSVEPEYYYRYAQCLKSVGNYTEASKMMELYYDIIGEGLKNEEMKNIVSPLEEIKNQSGRYDIALQKLGSVSDFGIVFSGDKEVIYTSSGPLNNSSRRNHNWTNKPYYKLFSATVDDKGGLTNSVLLKGDINEGIKLRYNQTTPTITKDGNTMYFTRNNYYDNDIQRDKYSGINKLKIYRAHKIDNNKWGDIEELPYPINSDGFSSAHPALSPDGKQFYFVSDRRNVPGNTDIYVVGIREDGTFEKNLHPLSEKINTKGRETFPFVDDYGILYFASDGHLGLGGLDIFGAVQDKQGEYHIFNLGEPVNSASDDFSYIINNETKRGFFASNRENAKEDYIYSFIENKTPIYPFDLSPVVNGVLKDSISGVPIVEAQIIVYNSKNEKVSTVTTNEKGEYSIPLIPLQDYTFVFEKRGFTKETLKIDGMSMQSEKEISAVLFNDLVVIVDDMLVTLHEGDDLTKILKLNPIYFDYGLAGIRKSSKQELDKLIDLLKRYPNIAIDIRSHTDSKGTVKTNLALSEKRAKATMDYIIKEGNISSDRITGRGYGESQLLNHCKDGVRCTEVEHQENRRSEFIIKIRN